MGVISVWGEMGSKRHKDNRKWWHNLLLVLIFLEIGHQKAAIFLGKSCSSKASGRYRVLLRSLSSWDPFHALNLLLSPSDCDWCLLPLQSPVGPECPRSQIWHEYHLPPQWELGNELASQHQVCHRANLACSCSQLGKALTFGKVAFERKLEVNCCEGWYWCRCDSFDY